MCPSSISGSKERAEKNKERRERSGNNEV